MAGHVFLSYSRTDLDYVTTLAGVLSHAGVPVWIDNEINYGDTWVSVVCEKIDTCDAFVPIMTPESWGSTWVAREIARAELAGKPILPILLDGQVFFTLGHLQYEDVRGGVVPKERFIARLKNLTTTDQPTDPPSADAANATTDAANATISEASATTSEASGTTNPASGKDAAPVASDEPPVIAVLMPSIGEGVTEATVDFWLKGVGDPVEIGEPLVELTSDKVDIELPSPAAGVLVEILLPEGETGEVGSEIAAIAPTAKPAPEPAPQDPPRHVSVTMPPLGESVTEGFITRWLKEEGDTVAVGEPLLEVSTDKVDTEIPSPVAGVLEERTVFEDDVVGVGEEICIIDVKPAPR